MTTLIDEACWDRGCPCHDDRESKGVAVVEKKEWVGLTDEEIQDIRLKTLDSVATNYEAYRAIETKLKEKNT
jgi:hypothetical protein